MAMTITVVVGIFVEVDKIHVAYSDDASDTDDQWDRLARRRYLVDVGDLVPLNG